MRRAVSFVASAVAFNEYCIHLKSVPCPRCHLVGHLIRHGYLKGYGKSSQKDVHRGWRIFCSNRNRQSGCGKTHSVLLVHCLRGRMIQAPHLWCFLQGMLAGLNPKSAWSKTTSGLSAECGNHLWKAWPVYQMRLRILLCQLLAPLVCAQSNPLFEVIVHLQAAFKHAECPISAFQLHFQRDFLSRDSDAPG